MFARIMKFAPLRGWRAFTGEVGVIVLGVLVAVAIGKLVDALDWRQRVTEAGTFIATDTREGTQFFLEERRRVSPCLHRQLDLIENAIRASAKTGGLTVPVRTDFALQRTYAHPLRLWTSTLWASLVADNVPIHMKDSERRWFESFFDSLRRMDEWNADEAVLAAELGALAQPTTLSDDGRLDLLRLVSRLRYRVAFMDLGVAQIQASLVERGLKYQIPASDIVNLKTEKWCRRNGLL